MIGTNPMRGAAQVAAATVVVLALVGPASAADLARLRNGFTIRHEHHALAGDTTRLFFSSDDSSYVDVPTAEIEGFERDLTPASILRAASPAPTEAGDFKQVVSSASAANHLDPDLVNSVIHAESGFNPHATSRKGAQGLMQLMPTTADRLGVANPFDPQTNVNGGTHYLRQLLERYNFDLVKALAAYNAGPQSVEYYGGVPPYHETRAYVARVVHEYNRKKIATEKQSTTSHAKSISKTGAGVSTATQSR